MWIFFRRMTPKKKFYYILVNRIMANFQFRGCRAKILQIKLIFERLRWVGSSQNLSKNFQISANPNGMKDFRIGAGIKKIIFVSKLKIRVGCHGH